MDRQLIDFLACPVCKGDLEEQNTAFICSHCKLVFPVIDGVPDFIPDNARPLDTFENTAEKPSGDSD